MGLFACKVPHQCSDGNVGALVVRSFYWIALCRLSQKGSLRYRIQVDCVKRADVMVAIFNKHVFFLKEKELEREPKEHMTGIH